MILSNRIYRKVPLMGTLINSAVTQFFKSKNIDCERYNFFKSIHSSDIESIKQILNSKKICVDERDLLDKWTALHHSSFIGNTKVVRILVSFGANINIKDKQGITPLHLACLNGHVSTLQELIKSGADVNAKDELGRTPFDVCSSFKIAKELQKCYGFEINKQNNVDAKALNYYGFKTKALLAKRRWWKIYLQSKRIIKKQVLSIIARILFIHLLELFIDHFHRISPLALYFLTPPDKLVNYIIKLFNSISKYIYLIMPYILIVHNYMTYVIYYIYNSVITLVLFLGIQFPYDEAKLLFIKLVNYLYPLYNIFWSFAGRLLSLVIITTISLSHLKIIMINICSLFIHTLFGVKSRIILYFTPMLSIREFFTGIFGPLLSVCLHWLISVNCIIPLHIASELIFGKAVIMNEEETGVMVIFIIVTFIYGSIFLCGYVFKILVLLICQFDSPMKNNISYIVKWLSNGKDIKELSYYSPNMFHHHAGAMIILIGLMMILFYKINLIFSKIVINCFGWMCCKIKKPMNLNWKFKYPKKYEQKSKRRRNNYKSFIHLINLFFLIVYLIYIIDIQTPRNWTHDLSLLDKATLK